jgi:predicted glycosyltransferase
MINGGRIVAQGSYGELVETSEEFRWLIAEEPAPRVLRRPRFRPEGHAPERVLFYSHNGVGVGHLQRQLDLATAYRKRHPESAILLSTGSRGASMFEFPEGLDYVKLPSLQMVDRNRNWEPRDLPLPVETLVAMRTEMLRETVRNFTPDLFVADFMPAGPYGELLPALDELKRQGGAAIAGFRDILDEPDYVRELWHETGIYDTLRTHYAEVCVYGDAAVQDFSEYGLGATAGIPVHYCGYLGRPRPEPRTASAQDGPYIIATSGGGADGSFVLDQFLGAAEHLRPELGGRWLAVTGPLMADADHERLVRLGARFGVEIRRVEPKLRSEVASADCIVAMAGYNTVCDVLSYRSPAVFVPRSGPNLEQSLRADRLERWNAAEILRPSELSSREMANSIRSVISRGEPPLPPVSLDGFENALNVFDTTLAQARAA